MPALLFDWNQAGFNDTATLNCRNGVAGQTEASIMANLIASEATNFRGLNILFIFPNGDSIGTWADNIKANFVWYDIMIQYI